MHLRTIRIGLLTVGMALILAACAGEPDEPIQPLPSQPEKPAIPTKPDTVQDVPVALGSIPRNTAPDVAPPDLETLAAGNTAFAFDLYHQIGGTADNLFYSPYSISLALAMTYAGARGNTETQMADVMHYTLPQESLHPAFNALDLDLTTRNTGEEDSDPEMEGDRFTLNIANALWGQQGFPFEEDFLNTISENYGAGLRLVDYINDPESARLLINDWVAEQTEDRIKDIVPEGAITPLTRLVLANAIYFNASWLHAFSEDSTQDAPFYLLDGDTVDVQMMLLQESFVYGEGENYQAVSLPYYGGSTAMIVLLPSEGQFEAFESSLSGESFTAILNAMSGADVRLALPQFEYEQSTNLNDALIGLGMTDAFDDQTADFSGMSSEKLFISDVLHKAFVKVDESGTEAAAATVVVMRAESARMPDTVIEMTVDRPFIFAIYDYQTGTVLFVGRVLNPAE